MMSLDGELIRKLAIPPLPLLPNSSSVLNTPVLFFSLSSLTSVKLALELDDVPVPLVSLLGVRKNQLDEGACLGEGDDDSEGIWRRWADGVLFIAIGCVEDVPCAGSANGCVIVCDRELGGRGVRVKSTSISPMSSLRVTSLGAVLALFLRTPHRFPTEPILLNSGAFVLPFSFKFSLSAASATATSESGLACRARTGLTLSE